MDARDVDLTVTRMRRPRSVGQGSAATGTAAAARAAARSRSRASVRAAGPAHDYPTYGSAALAPQPQETPDAALSARRSPRLAVAPPPPVTVPRAPFVVLVLLVVIGGVLGVLLLNTKVNENAFILDDLHAEQAVLDQRQQQLEQQIAQADSPPQLAAAARRLGLVEAEELAYLQLPAGEVASEPVPAEGEPSRTSQAGAGDQAGSGDAGSTETGAGETGSGGDQAGSDQAGSDQAGSDRNAGG